jgi:ABC-type transport system substrate-binding protein
MKAISSETTREELAAIIVSALEASGIEAVLTGGSVVSIYTDNQYESRDLDFISPSTKKEIDKAMTAIGFTASGKDYLHPDTAFTVEFPTGPLGIGDEHIVAEGEMEVEGTVIKMLSPTQSAMDRLSQFYFWQDRQGLDQAVMICKSQNVSLDKIRAWSEKNGELEKYKIFVDALKR